MKAIFSPLLESHPIDLSGLNLERIPIPAGGPKECVYLAQRSQSNEAKEAHWAAQKRQSQQERKPLTRLEQVILSSNDDDRRRCIEELLAAVTPAQSKDQAYAIAWYELFERPAEQQQWSDKEWDEYFAEHGNPRSWMRNDDGHWYQEAEI